MKVSKGTLIRTVLFLFALANFILKQYGKTTINIEESEVVRFVEAGITIAILVVSWWKNNSFSENAIKADKFLKQLKEEEKQ